MIYKSKRYLDLFISTIIIFFTLPIIIFCSILIILIDNQHPFFIQERSGINGKKIFIYKLQTISFKKNSQTTSNLGKFLRYTKIDELPQFINILKNDLSLIGPRPLYMEYNNFLSDQHKMRMHVKPGLTGYSQIKLFNQKDWNKKFDYDIYYVKNMSLKLDIKIFFESIIFVFKLFLSLNKRYENTIDFKKDFYENYVNKHKK